MRQQIEKVVEGGYNGERPPADDVCPICFDNFTIPCKTNCGHWFCASCILLVWMYGSAIQPCSCPLCFLPITNLVPKMSRLVEPEEDAKEVIQKVEQYNCLFIGGVRGLFLKLLAFPLIIKRSFRILMDPEGLTDIFYIMRFLALLLALCYEIGGYGYLPVGILRNRKWFEVGARTMIASLFLISIWKRWVLRRLARRLAAEQALDA